MQRLIFDESPLVVSPSLASTIGLGEAIVLQQIHYWTQRSEKVHDGKCWTYNSYPDWQLQFPWWSERTIQRIIVNLEKRGLIIIGNFNKMKMDKTKWYRINYDVLDTISAQEKPEDLLKTTNWRHDDDKLAPSSRQIGTFDDDKLAPPIPKTNTETNTETQINQEIQESLPLGSFSVVAEPATVLVEQQAVELVDHFQKEFGRKGGGPKVTSKNLPYWLEEYSLEEIKQAITNAAKDDWWKDKLTLEMLLRKRKPTIEGESQEYVDRIGKFLTEAEIPVVVVNHLTELETWETAKEMNVSWNATNQKASDINKMIDSGEIKKYLRGRTAKQCLRDWLNKDLGQGKLSHCNEIEALSLDDMHPRKVEARKKLDAMKQELKDAGIL